VTVADGGEATPGGILSGATTYFSFFLADPPVSFNLAQCACFYVESVWFIVRGF
jgi:hypothetical protein